jgi:hypothetical protein
MPRRAWPAFVPLLLACAAAHGAGACAAKSGAKVLPLVELYTAEGCSDCPPADRWLSEFTQRTPPTQAAALAFHVDYWDDQGWPDRFATALNSQRQELRVRLAKQDVTYTPQVMVGRDVKVKWNRASDVDAALSRARGRDASLALGMQVAGDEGGALRVDVQARPEQGAAASAGPALVWLALYQDGLSTEVEAGENKGATLRHDHVVRMLAGPWQVDAATPLASQAKVQLPPQAPRAQLGLVLFAESRANGEALQALVLPLAACAPSPAS